MRLFSGLYAGRESLVSHGTALSTIADNVANSNTPGYKAGRAEFGDLLASGLGTLAGTPLTTGNGSQVSDISYQLTQGAIDQTDRALDVAIDGRGFFVVQDTATTTDFYTRAGNFITDQDGNLVTLSGENVMGFTEASPDTLVTLNVNTVTGSASATTAIGVTGNLDAAAPIVEVPANPATFQAISDVSNFSSPVRAIDSIGGSHDVVLHFFHTAAGAWTVQAYVDAAEVGGEAGTPSLIGAAEITFDETAQVPDGEAPTITATPAWGNGAAAGNFTIDFSNMTGFAASSTLSNVTADGVIPGQLSGLTINENGTIDAQLDNGEFVTVGTIALATFANANGLDRVGNNRFSPDGTAGTVVVGAPDAEGRGSLVGGAIELSNSSLEKEFVSMVQIQRGYQAGSQVISAVNELLNTTIQIA